MNSFGLPSHSDLPSQHCLSIYRLTTKLCGRSFDIHTVVSIYRLTGEQFRSSQGNGFDQSTVSHVGIFDLPSHMLFSIYWKCSIYMYRLTGWTFSIYRLTGWTFSIYRLTAWKISIYRLTEYIRSTVSLVETFRSTVSYDIFDRPCHMIFSIYRLTVWKVSIYRLAAWKCLSIDPHRPLWDGRLNFCQVIRIGSCETVDPKFWDGRSQI